VTPPLYTASVPVFLHYLTRIEGLMGHATPERLRLRLAPGMFTLGEQMATAMRLCLRVSYPLAGRAVPAETGAGTDGPGLAQRLAITRGALGALTPGDFAGAEARVVRHVAGFAELEQDGATFLHLFGMPNFLFHTGMAFAILRANGAAIGKADFDGQHDYPPGFSF
jgi:hypothetical protein